MYRIVNPLTGLVWMEGLGQDKLYEMPCAALSKEDPLAMMRLSKVSQKYLPDQFCAVSNDGVCDFLFPQRDSPTFYLRTTEGNAMHGEH